MECHTSYVSDNIIFQLFPWNYHAHVLFFVSTEDLCTSVHLFCGLSLHRVINAHTYCAYIVTLELIRAAICIALSITINSSGNYCCFLVLNLNNQMNRKGNSKGERMVTIIQLVASVCAMPCRDMYPLASLWRWVVPTNLSKSAGHLCDHSKQKKGKHAMCVACIQVQKSCYYPYHVYFY
jgi:hypothetical protein